MDIKEILGSDENTQEILNTIYGVGMWKGVNTKEKRAAWRYGYEGGKAGKFSNPDTKDECFHQTRLLHPKMLTDMDAYYIVLGRCMM